MQLKIRRINSSDSIVLSELAKKTFYDTFTGTCSEEDMRQFLFDSFSVEQINKEIRNENDLYFFAEIGNKPVGYIRFMEDYSGLDLMSQWKALELKRLYILKEFHGKGVAQALMDFFLEYASMNKFEVVWLGVWENNLRAQKFYQKYGFTNSGYSHNFPIGKTPQNDMWFWHFLNQ